MKLRLETVIKKILEGLNILTVQIEFPNIYWSVLTMYLGLNNLDKLSAITVTAYDSSILILHSQEINKM